MRTALIATLRNEATRLGEFLESLEGQTRVPDVVVITDAASTDATQTMLAEFAARTSLPFRWVIVPGNRSRGRNAAIRLADADLVAVTDVCVVEPTWFERIVSPLERGEADVVSGWYELLVGTPRERAYGLLTQYSIDQVDPDTFLPSSRSVAFTRAAWERVGGYPEHLETSEDTAFDLSLKAAGMRFVFARDAVVRWRPPTTLRAASAMIMQFARTDGQAGLFLWSYTGYGFLYLGILAADALILAGIFWWPAWVLLGLGFAAYLGFRVRKVLRAGLWSQFPLAALVACQLDISRMVGYIQGRNLRARAPRP